ncbi:MAG TPA: transcription antitermination factor NusB, partial [Bdellovibrionota bacterium]|nr:transcription antitermination factor NusB [Bdellovibrionota bacterium]
IPREAAVSIIHQVYSAGGKYDPLFEQAAAKLEGPARGWLREVTSGTLRWIGRLELILSTYSKAKPVKGRRLAALSLGAYQILVTDAFPALVVSETVEWFKVNEGTEAGSFANAVLRRLTEDKDKWKTSGLHGPGAEAAWASLPPWMWNRLVSERGREWAMAFAEASLERPPLWIRARRAEWTPQAGEPGLVEGAWRVPNAGLIESRDGFAEAEFLVQDISNQTLVHDVAEQVLLHRGAGETGSPRALDVCAAPGGKSIGLAWSGFAVTALEKNERRRRRLQENADRLAPALGSVTVGDLSLLDQKIENTLGFDLVWLDPPCSGTGVLRRHPEIRWHRQESDLSALREIQRDLIPRAWKQVRNGGHLLYSVCSVLTEEGEGAYAWSTLPGAVEVKRWLFSPHLPPSGDGFWAVLLRRQSS